MKWRLLHTATSTEYKIWEETMQAGFRLCVDLSPDLQFDDTIAFRLAKRREDARIFRWWNMDTRMRGVSVNTVWEDYKKFLRAKFLAPSEIEDKVIVP